MSRIARSHDAGGRGLDGAYGSRDAIHRVSRGGIALVLRGKSHEMAPKIYPTSSSPPTEI